MYKTRIKILHGNYCNISKWNALCKFGSFYVDVFANKRVNQVQITVRKHGMMLKLISILIFRLSLKVSLF